MKVIDVTPDDGGPADVEHVLLGVAYQKGMRLEDVRYLGRAIRRPSKVALRATEPARKRQPRGKTP